jgi:hypothetical protein
MTSLADLVPLVRADGSAVDVTITLGTSARVYCDVATPMLVLDLGHSRVGIELATLDQDGLRIVQQCAAATDRLRACVAEQLTFTAAHRTDGRGDRD